MNPILLGIGLAVVFAIVVILWASAEVRSTNRAIEARKRWEDMEAKRNKSWRDAQETEWASIHLGDAPKRYAE